MSSFFVTRTILLLSPGHPQEAAEPSGKEKGENQHGITTFSIPPDAKTEPLLRQDEYTAPGVSRFEAPTIRALAEKLSLSPEALERTVAEFNASIQPGTFNPAVKDGKCTQGIHPAKSNWALPLDTPPFYGFAVTCGITFTFGGVRIDAAGRVLDRAGHPIAGLHAAGEIVGGLFYHNYPGGSGLMAGAVFGRRAGTSAAQRALALGR
jgi:tricarballylate dehydrogenase